MKPHAPALARGKAVARALLFVLAAGAACAQPPGAPVDAVPDLPQVRAALDVPAFEPAPSSPEVSAPRAQLARSVRVFLLRVRPWLRIALPCTGIAFVAVLGLLGASPAASFLRGLLLVPLAVAAWLSVESYTNFHFTYRALYALEGQETPRGNAYFDYYEFYHYYIGAKYADELGYTEMYNASIVADAERGLTYSHAEIRALGFGLETGTPGADAVQRGARIPRPYVAVREVLEPEEQERIRGLFTPERWEEFVGDITYFKKRLGPQRWSGILRDKGYNATPVWTMTGGLLSHAAPTGNERALHRLALLDPLLIALALLSVAWAYGPVAACLVALFFGANFIMMQSPTMKEAFLRTDWVMLTLTGAALVKKGWYKTAGVLLAYAGLARIFPFIFVFGIGARGLVELLRTRRVQRCYLEFGAAFAAGCAVFVLGSIAYAGGLDHWRGFFAKIGYHQEDISTWRVGFKYLFLQTYALVPPGTGWWAFKAQLQIFMQEHAVAWWGIQGAVLLLSAWLVRNLRDDEAILYSFVPVFFLVAPTHYYYMMLVIPFCFFAARNAHPLRAAGMAFLFAVSLVGWQYQFRGWRFPLAYDMSAILLVFVLYIMIDAWLEGRLARIAARHGEAPAA